MGTIVNMLAIAIGVAGGLIFKKWIQKEMLNHVMVLVGLSIVILGLEECISSMVSVENNALEFNGIMLLIVSLSIGSLIGDTMKLDERLNKLGKKIEQKLKMGTVAEAFTSSSILY